ncbi:hypothetical protein [Bernardetia sp.]|uniref:hypothetical protein n=1 Tax=Bernardetia sp. TaxID=1937974 RepID=UPI0025B8BE37|nr:hypothetical protein [Bernardetia sp.]
MNTSNYKNYLDDFIDLQLDKLSELEQEISSCEKDDKDYIIGQIMGYYDSLTTLKSQAELFSIDLPKLQNLDLEKYLMLK